MSKYYYLISTLPAISLWEKPEINLKEFLKKCSEWLEKKDMNILNDINILPSENPEIKNATVERWCNWETNLRNRIARIRASKLDMDQSAYLHEEKDYFSESDRVLQEAIAAGNPLEQEKILDEQRWIFLNSLEAGHIFNVDILCVYKMKLQLCEKWLDRITEKGKENFNKALDGLYTKDILKIE